MYVILENACLFMPIFVFWMKLSVYNTEWAGGSQKFFSSRFMTLLLVCFDKHKLKADTELEMKKIIDVEKWQDFERNLEIKGGKNLGADNEAEIMSRKIW